MIERSDLLAHCNQLLQPEVLRDYCPNGLQVSGRQRIQKIVTGVTASLALIEKAIAEKADAIFAHHGYFWKGESPAIVGVKHGRIQALLNHDINLFAYHLPLDVHPHLGNNIQLAQHLGLDISGQWDVDGIQNLVWHGALPTASKASDFVAHCEKQLQRAPLHIPGRSDSIKTIAWCTGAAHRYLELAAERGIDCYLTGEISESTVHMARETGIHLIAAGHHATERYGIQALGQHLSQQLELEHQFIDVDNPV